MRTDRPWTRRGCLLALCSGVALAAPLAVTAPVAGALHRPALSARKGGQSVLLAAARAGGRVVAVGERGLILTSMDDGTSWIQQPSPVSSTLTAVRFVDDSHGVAVGHGGVILTSADGGTSWTLVFDGRQAAELALTVARERGDVAAIQSAERLVADGPDKPFLDVWQSSRDEILAVGAYGLVFGSSDGGKSWAPWMDRLDNPRGLHMYAVRRRGNTLVIVGEQGLMLRSDDAGRSFRREDTPYKGSFFTLELPGDHDVVVAGLRGNALRSGDGGGTWTALQVPMAASITSSQLGVNGEVLLTNQAGFVMRLMQDRLEPVHTQPLPPIHALVPGGGPLIALTLQGAMPVPTAKNQS